MTAAFDRTPGIVVIHASNPDDVDDVDDASTHPDTDASKIAVGSRAGVATPSK
ncbi:hypothetical protein Rhow_004689 [Rhodococcus wratislaviensis]|uniref:Uncharacterized protein n=1 Tax=Rhodococcus wratislaviensis TaxID=44752 RepID=A0A402BZH3_RHOWR|nr:hypothetical protein Rhow_004689 [Rhodococcus wratislaviensis]